MFKRLFYTLIAAAIIFFIVFLFIRSDEKYVYTNALFISGFSIFAVGVFSLIVNGNMFALVTYGIRKVIEKYKKDITPEERLPASYFEYLEERNDQPLKYSHFFIVSSIILVISYILAVR